MTDLGTVHIADLEWQAIGEDLDKWGFAVTRPLLDAEQCRALIDLFEVDEAFRSTIVMSRHAFGEGTYRYFADPLPSVVQRLRVELYDPLAQIANGWAAQLGGVRGGGATPADAAAPALLGRWVQLPAPGHLRRRRVPAPGDDHALRAGRGLHRR